MKRIAVFITPHGYGHATRSIAVLEALQERFPELCIDICTTIPKSLFTDSLQNIRYHPVAGDVGVIQTDALTVDLTATAKALDTLLPYPDQLIDNLAAKLDECELIVSDIAPLGILVAERLTIPSVLVENFTWDWIYQPYLATTPSIHRHIAELKAIYTRVNLHIQSQPVCKPDSAASLCPPIFRKRRLSNDMVRRNLQATDRPLIVITMGGIDLHLSAWQQLEAYPECLFVLAGQDSTTMITDNCMTLARTTDIHHPDLIGAADLVVSKSGYSTLAECFQGGTRALCITRPHFQESLVLEQFVTTRLQGKLITEAEFLSGLWLESLPALLHQPSPEPACENGADVAAELISTLCHC